MKTLTIATLVGTIILYIFLAIVHTVLNPMIHEGDFKYTANQDNILAALTSANLENGLYMIPSVPPGSPMEDHEKYMTERMGKPWGYVIYNGEMTYGASLFIMSFVYNLITVLIVCIALAAASNRLTSFGQRLWFVMLFALFVIFANIMSSYNWYQFPMHFLKGEIIDIVGGMFCVGLWLAWYYGRVATKVAQ